MRAGFLSAVVAVVLACWASAPARAGVVGPAAETTSSALVVSNSLTIGQWLEAVVTEPVGRSHRFAEPGTGNRVIPVGLLMQASPGIWVVNEILAHVVVPRFLRAGPQTGGAQDGGLAGMSAGLVGDVVGHGAAASAPSGRAAAKRWSPAAAPPVPVAPPSSVPEPTTAWVLVLAGMMLGRRR